MLFWGLFNRLSEIAQWENWKSKFGRWFDTYFEKGPKWFPFRDSYHTFKALPVYIICIIVGIFAGWNYALYAYIGWSFGQYAGLLTKR
jgi:hypothetical protein